MIPRRPIPAYPSKFRSQNDFGRNGIKWGTGETEARLRVASITLEELQSMGLTLEMAQDWAVFYENEILRNPMNDSARGRAVLMRHVAELLTGGAP